ncbi:hypothetical protein JMJ99_11680 [Companilactobacillus zhachilii]|uniref:hypothetical protein n=1 Tax=Companilactobacillus zhachilii TaxID=2304606 RepID=UPI0019205D35|nr:hypothetical protein [Companilactobacillus zhachilii]MBL3532033.1 hypothetical protein [Companilactobacillus zhachilii]
MAIKIITDRKVKYNKRPAMLDELRALINEFIKTKPSISPILLKSEQFKQK